MKYIAPLVILAFWGLVIGISNYLKKRGSKLGQEKPIYNYIGYGIYIVLGIGAVILIILAALNQ